MDELKISISKAADFDIIDQAGNKETQRFFKSYQSKDIQAKAKVSKIQLINWTQQDIILPSIDARGRGKARTYSYQNLIEAMICKELNRLTIGMRFAKELMQWMREREWNFIFSYSQYMERTLQNLKTATVIGDTWAGKTPPKGQEILSILEENGNDVNDVRIQDIISKAQESERTLLMGWLAGYEEIQKLCSNNAPFRDESLKIQRVHTIWEYLRLYPSYFEFYLIISMNQDDKIHAFIYDVEGSNAAFDAKMAVVINLQALKSEAGDVYEEGES